MIASFADSGLQITEDGGENWNQMTHPSDTESPALYVDFSGDQLNTVYALLQDLSIHSTTNQGEIWKTIHSK